MAIFSSEGFFQKALSTRSSSGLQPHDMPQLSENNPSSEVNCLFSALLVYKGIIMLSLMPIALLAMSTFWRLPFFENLGFTISYWPHRYKAQVPHPIFPSISSLEEETSSHMHHTFTPRTFLVGLPTPRHRPAASPPLFTPSQGGKAGIRSRA